MEADSPAGPGAPEPLAEGAAAEFSSLLRRIKGKLFTWQ
uniref:Solute carrier family 35 member F2 n=1 Tax=Homo sapiens TaxID=9606 RepID=E9PRY2_HUMAN